MCNDGLTTKQEKSVIWALRVGVPAICILCGLIGFIYVGWVGLVIPGFVLAVWIVPCRYDPAIQIKERQERKAGRWVE